MLATSSSQTLAFTRMDFWINTLSVFSTILLGVFAALAGMLVFLIWKQNEMRKNAEEEMEKINKITKKIESFYRLTSDLTRKTKKMMESAGNIMKRSIHKSKKIDGLIAGLKKESKEVIKIGEKIKKIRGGIQTDARSLATVSEMFADYSEPSHKEEQLKKLLADLVSPPKKKTDAQEAVSQAQEAVSQATDMLAGKKE